VAIRAILIGERELPRHVEHEGAAPVCPVLRNPRITPGIARVYILDRFVGERVQRLPGSPDIAIGRPTDIDPDRRQPCHEYILSIDARWESTDAIRRVLGS
jgi:hypothetical protein